MVTTRTTRAVSDAGAAPTGLTRWGATADTEPLARKLGVTDAAGAARLIAYHRARRHAVVLTSGCFDVLHLGHVAYLEEARRLGDVLAVAVNSDESVRRLKGPRRPVSPAVDRAAVVAALACVDLAVIFDEDDPRALIEVIRPDIFVKGGDYPAEPLLEAGLVRRLGGEVRILGHVAGRSTSGIIERIQEWDGPAASPGYGETGDTGGTAPRQRRQRDGPTG